VSNAQEFDCVVDKSKTPQARCLLGCWASAWWAGGLAGWWAGGLVLLGSCLQSCLLVCWPAAWLIPGPPPAPAPNPALLQNQCNWAELQRTLPGCAWEPVRRIMAVSRGSLQPAALLGLFCWICCVAGLLASGMWGARLHCLLD
jgi:hypothetical protein